MKNKTNEEYNNIMPKSIIKPKSKRGGPGRGQGRKKLLINTRPYKVYLDKATADYYKSLGGNNISGGIRKGRVILEGGDHAQ